MNNVPVIVFIHGGPGLSSSYFRGWFDYLQDSYDLFFYDQDYSKCKPGNAIDTLADELSEKISILAQEYNSIVLYAHSWGTFLLLKSILKIRQGIAWDKIKKIILSNPADLNWDSYQESGNHLFDDMSAEEIEEITNCTDGLKMMQIALPYYVADRVNVPEIVISKYDLAAYDMIDAEMKDYDISGLVNYLPLENTHTIYCEFDFEKRSGSRRLAEMTISHEFANSGHFPFAEQPQRYSLLINSILN